MTVDNKVMEKIRKLFAKADPKNNPSEAEVEQAMLLAQKLMVENGLTMGDIAVEEKKKEVVDNQISQAQRIPWWHKQLANIIAKNFRCTCYYKGGVGLYFIGLKQDFELAKSLFEYAVSAINYQSGLYLRRNRHANPYASAAGLKNDYISGFLAGLQAKFKEQVEKENWGLILVKDKEVIKAEDRHNFRRGQASSHARSGSDEAYSKGYADGNSFSGAKGQLKGRQ